MTSTAGCRLNILPDRVAAGDALGFAHWCGPNPGVGPDAEATCPNCLRPLFPVFQLDHRDNRIRELHLWRGDSLQVFVCPTCLLYMEPYWVRFDGVRPQVVGGYRDGGVIIQDIDRPYDYRSVELLPLAPPPVVLPEDLVAPPGKLDKPWVHHQIGGYPWSLGYDSLDCCRCGNAMRFAGIVDSEDDNMPLTENGGSSVCLIIGDADHLNIFTCRECQVVGFRWAY